jgi:hypothetical protein
MLCIEAHELAHLGRDRPSWGKKTVLLWKLFSHFHQTSAKKVFTRKDLDSREVTYFLMIVEFEEILCSNVIVGPHDVPLLRLTRSLSHPTQLLNHKFDDFVVRLCIASDLLERLTTISPVSTLSRPFFTNRGDISFFVSFFGSYVS